MREITDGELSKILKEHKKWRENEDEGKKANLSNANLSGAYLFGAYLFGADLSGADLSDANLSDADLSGAKLSGAKLRGSAYLRGTDLSGANLRGAYLSVVLGLSIEQLSTVETLYEAKLDPELMEQVKDKYPHLLKKSKSEE
jgi:uncharacterized protein YjbI with pentapeptide repeats